jgi:cyclase
MKKKRLIPVLLLKNGFLVQSKSFSRYQNLGDPVTAVKRLSDWASDELIYLDITREGPYDMRRDDKGHPNRNNIIDIIRDVSQYCHMPVTFGGRIRTLEDIALRVMNGGDKVSINKKALEDLHFVTQAAKEFGSQCIVVSIDALLAGGRYVVMSDGGRVVTEHDPAEWAKKAEGCGAGEIFLNSVDRDGTQQGYDIDLIRIVSEAVRIPVIACGGAGKWSHMAEVFDKTQADAVAAANIFHYYDQSVFLAKQYLYEHGYNVRSPDLLPVPH